MSLSRAPGRQADIAEGNRFRLRRGRVYTGSARRLTYSCFVVQVGSALKPPDVADAADTGLGSLGLLVPSLRTTEPMTKWRNQRLKVNMFEIMP